MPSWLIGPGLLIPPIFVPLFLCASPFSVAPSFPTPRVHRVEASQHLQAVDEQVRSTKLTKESKSLLAIWRELQRVELERRLGAGTSRSTVAKTQAAFGNACSRFFRRNGTDSLLAVGDRIALSLTRVTMELETQPTQTMEIATEMGGGFLLSARRSGLIDGKGRLQAHPVVPFALALAAFRVSCGIRPEIDMDPVELEGVDVYLLRFGSTLPLKARLKSLERYSKRHPDYPEGQARAVLLLKAGKRGDAFEALLGEGRENPRNLALRNYMLYSQEHQE